MIQQHKTEQRNISQLQSIEPSRVTRTHQQQLKSINNQVTHIQRHRLLQMADIGSTTEHQKSTSGLQARRIIQEAQQTDQVAQ